MAASTAEYRPRFFEPTLLHTLVERHLAELRAESFDADHPGGGVPAFVVRELEAFEPQVLRRDVAVADGR